MGNLESNTMFLSTPQITASARPSPLLCNRRSESFCIEPQKPFTNESPNSSSNVRQQSGLKNYLRGSYDLLLPVRSPRQPKRTNSMRSRSESRNLSKKSQNVNSADLSHSYNNLRLAIQPHIQISGDLKASQISLIRRLWKQEMKKCFDSELEMANRLLLRIFTIAPHFQAAFHLLNVPYLELQDNAVFQVHAKIVESVLSFVMSHLHDATAMSKPLQALGARHLIHTKIQYKSIYWKVVNQALVEFVDADRTSIDVFDAWNVLGNFCVEQMRIGYKIEYKIKKVIQRMESKKVEI